MRNNKKKMLKIKNNKKKICQELQLKKLKIFQHGILKY